MFRKIVGIALVPMMLVTVSAIGEEAVVRHLDVSGGDHEGHWVVFFSKPAAKNSPMGTAGVAVGKGESFEGAFGMTIQNSKPTVGTLSHEAVKALSEDATGAASVITLIDVTPEQYATVKAVVEDYSAREEFVDGAVDVTMNFAFDVFKNLPLKQPYRSGLGAAHTMNYYSDVGFLNRKLAKEGS